MKKWFGIVTFLMSLSVTACAHDSKGSEPSAAAAADNSCAAVSQMICTREYLPTNCTLGQEEFSGSNACEARKLAKAYACAKKVAYVEAEVSCSSKAVAEVGAEEPKDACTGETKPCTREFKPQICRIGDLSAKGNNHCEALNALKTSLCSKKLVFNEGEAACEAANATPSPKAKRSR